MPAETAPGLRALQSAMRHALLGGDSASLLELIEGEGIAAAERFGCHARNVSAGLIEVLSAAFPATRREAGPGNFRFAAGRFLASHPPAEARLLAYGAAFPRWLAGFGPARDKPWLAELARLEWARQEAYFAADARPLAPDSLGDIAPELVPALRFTLHPSLRLLRSDFLLHQLWLGEAPADGGEQHLLVLRPAHEVIQLPLPAGDAALVAGLAAGRTLGEAAAAALAVTPQLDLQQALFGHLVRGSFAAVQRA